MLVLFSAAVLDVRSSVSIPERVRGVARTVLVALEPIQAIWTQPLLAMSSFEPGLAHAGSVNVVTLCPIQTVALLGTVKAVRANRTLLLTPGLKQQFRLKTQRQGQRKGEWKESSSSTKTLAFKEQRGSGSISLHFFTLDSILKCKDYTSF